jgi:hypothetical protein
MIKKILFLVGKHTQHKMAPQPVIVILENQYALTSCFVLLLGMSVLIYICGSPGRIICGGILLLVLCLFIVMMHQLEEKRHNT